MVDCWMVEKRVVDIAQNQSVRLDLDFAKFLYGRPKTDFGGY